MTIKLASQMLQYWLGELDIGHIDDLTTVAEP